MVPTELGVTSVAVRGPQGETPAPSRDSTQTAEVKVPEPSPLAIRYYRSGNVLWAVGTGLSLLLPALLLYTGWSARMRSTAFRLGRSWLPSLMVYALLFTAVSAILGLPLTFYEGFVRQHAYGLSNQTLSKWVEDWLKGVGLSGLGLALVLWIPYLLLRRSRRWWLYAGLASAPIATFLLIVAPIWVDPLFNHFGPMKDHELEQRILQLAERAGIPGSRVYQVDKSVDTKTINAYVTGVGATKRVVLWDTILEKLNPDQVAFVAAHEMGHFVLGHVAALIGVITLLVTLSLYVDSPAGRAADLSLLRPLWIRPFGGLRVAAAAATAVDRRLTDHDAFGAGLYPASGARSRPFRARAHPGQSRGRHDVRAAAAGEPRGAPTRRLVYALAEQPSVTG